MYEMVRPVLQWVTVEIDDGCDVQIECNKERPREACCDQGEGWHAREIEVGGWGGGGGAVQEKPERGLCVRCAKKRHVSEFWKTVYEKFGRKAFSIFLH